MASIAAFVLPFVVACAFLPVAFPTALSQPAEFFDPATVQRKMPVDSLSFITHSASELDPDGDFLSFLHTTTSESFLRETYELFDEEGDSISIGGMRDLTYWLRRLDIFDSIDIRLPATWKGGNLTVETYDKSSLDLDMVYESDQDRLGLLLIEKNLAGQAISLGLGADVTTSDESRRQIYASFRTPALIVPWLNLDAWFTRSDRISYLAVDLYKPFHSLRTKMSYGLRGRWFKGEEPFASEWVEERFPEGNEASLYRRDTARTQRIDASGWFSSANGERDAFRASLAVDMNRTTVDTGTPGARAFDNSVAVFGGLSSLRRDYVYLRDYDFSGTRMVPIGAQGRISIGKISPIAGGLDNVVYLGAEARQGVMKGRVYLFGSIEAGTALARGKESMFTLQRATGSLAAPLGPGIVATRIEQSTIWRWPRHVLTSLGLPDDGVRGYEVYDYAGDNRFVLNLDYRLFPVLDVSWFDVGLAAFYDIGAVWNQGQSFTNSRFHSSAGFGIRLGESGGANAGIFRIDVAYNFTERSFWNFVFSSREAFDAFGTLEYRPPAPYIP